MVYNLNTCILCHNIHRSWLYSTIYLHGPSWHLIASPIDILGTVIGTILWIKDSLDTVTLAMGSQNTSQIQGQPGHCRISYRQPGHCHRTILLKTVWATSTWPCAARILFKFMESGHYRASNRQPGHCQETMLWSKNSLNTLLSWPWAAKLLFAAHSINTITFKQDSLSTVNLAIDS